MKKLEELDWFNLKWATSVRDATRRLVCAYAEAYDDIERLSPAVRLVTFTGLHRPALIVFKPLFRDAAAKHIDAMLRQTSLLAIRAFRASRPTHDDLRFNHAKHPSEEEKKLATEKLLEFKARQQAIAALLEEANADVSELRERIANEGKGAAGLFKKIAGIIRRFLPVVWAWWAAILIDRVTPGSQLQMWGIAGAMTLVYHLLGLAGLPFHDAAERKHVYFEGFMGQASDGLNPVAPEMSRLEKKWFSQFKQKPPLVILWDQAVPLLHYTVAGVFVIYIAWKFPAEGIMRARLWAAAAALTVVYFWRLKVWWLLLRMRSSGHSVVEIVTALAGVLQVLEPEDKEDAKPAGDV